MQQVQDNFVVRKVDRDEKVYRLLIAWYHRRSSLRDVDVTVKNGIAILRGQIASLRDRALAIDLALDAGADEVQSELMMNWPPSA
jgi:osmotically-inducible protein OsmY